MSDSNGTSPLPAQTVDRRFQEKVWSWLTRHPEVSVGKNKEGNHLSLTDVERLATALTQQPRAGAKESSTEDASGETRQVSDADFQPRAFVSKERSWLAITGHEPDETKVPATEFALLSIIAPHKSQGIAQPELVKLSGQDKRSVPKRTDSLHQKGYIEKKPINMTRARTSLCTLRGFVEDQARNVVTDAPAGQEADRGIIDVKAFADQLIATIRKHRIISRADLKYMLGFNDRWSWRFLSRALRKFERIGVIKRVRAKLPYSRDTNMMHSCIIFVREPSEKDLETFFLYEISLPSTTEQDEENPNEDQEEDPVPEKTNEGPLSSYTDPAEFEESGRALPIWTPDRNVYNLLFDVVDSAGTRGITQAVCRNSPFI